MTAACRKQFKNWLEISAATLKLKTLVGSSALRLCEPSFSALARWAKNWSTHCTPTTSPRLRGLVPQSLRALGAWPRDQPRTAPHNHDRYGRDDSHCKDAFLFRTAQMWVSGLWSNKNQRQDQFHRRACDSLPGSHSLFLTIVDRYRQTDRQIDRWIQQKKER